MLEVEDYFDKLGEVALGSRLKRLSDKMMSDALRVYKYTGQVIQPKWFSLMSLLADKKHISVVQAADLLGLTQPCISQFSREMFKEGLVEFETDPDDLRRKIMSLSTKGRRKFKKMSKVRKAVRAAAISVCTEVEHDFYIAIQQFEKALARKSLLERTLENYNE